MAAPEPAPVAEPQAAPESSDRPALSPEQQAALEKMKELARRMQSFDTMKEPTLAPVTPEPLENSEPTSLVTINDASQDATDGLSLVESEVPPEMPAPVAAVVPESDEHPIQELQRVEKPKTSKFWLFAGILLCLAVAVQGVCLMNDRVLNKFPQTEPVFEKACKVFSCKVMPKKPSPFKVADATFERVRDHQYAIRFTLINPSSDPLPAPDLLLMINGAQGDLIAKRTIVPSYYMPEGVTEFQAGEQIRSGFAVTLSESTAPETIRLTIQ
ncbi:MAG TPA: hypothetical protein DCW60_02850 [Sutterella sp.]|nr:hypothetical protein [Sutterella sp.]